MWEATPETVDLLNVQNSSDPQLSSTLRFTGVANSADRLVGRSASAASSSSVEGSITNLEGVGVDWRKPMCAQEMRMFRLARHICAIVMGEKNG